jgi:hypothetical protein
MHLPPKKCHSTHSTRNTNEISMKIQSDIFQIGTKNKLIYHSGFKKKKNKK